MSPDFFHSFEAGGDEALHLLPPHLQDGIREYVHNGREFGHFLQAVVANDLTSAVGRMNPPSFEGLKSVVEFFYNYCPSDCWGGPGKYEAWIAKFKEEGDA